MRDRLVGLLALCAAQVWGVAGPAPALAEKRVALVIGNGAYQHNTKLPNPVNDAADMGAALMALGFETRVATDLDKRDMEEALGRFARLAREADAALFYYAGHAMQFAGINYLMPVDGRLRDEADLRYQFIHVDDVMADLAQARNVRIVILDACRDNPLAERLRATLPPARSGAVGRGLARMERADGFVTAFATQAGSVAADGLLGQQSRNSPFTATLLKHLPTPGLELVNLFRRVAVDVRTMTGGDQFPELSFALYQEFCLAGLPEAASPGGAAAPPVVRNHPGSCPGAGTRMAMAGWPTAFALLDDA